MRGNANGKLDELAKEVRLAHHHVEDSRPHLKSHVPSDTMTANDVEQASQQPGPTAKATMVAVPIKKSAPKNIRWLMRLAGRAFAEPGSERT